MNGSVLRGCALLLMFFAAGCRHGMGPGAEVRAPAETESLMRSVAELRMYLRHDTYRQPRPLLRDGRDFFAATLWRFDRLQQERGLETAHWQNVDFVIELGRARLLEKLRRYPEAQAAYARVAGRESTLQQAAREGRDGVAPLVALSAACSEPAGDELVWLESCARDWSHLAWELRPTRWEPQAREEAEAWEMLRVKRLAAAGRLEEALDAGRKLVEHHRHSKLYARHLIALGDVCADAARALEVTELVRLTDDGLEGRREALLEQAFAAYELASEGRSAEDRLAALARIEALRADREGGLASAP